MVLMCAYSTYAELSPSGTGVKIWCRGKLPFRGRKVVNAEAYQQGRYFTFTGQKLEGCSSGVVNCQSAIDWLVSNYFPPEAPRTAPVTPSTLEDYSGNDKFRRAVAYADATPGAISGQGGHNDTFAFACTVLNGFDLSRGQAFKVLQVWNQKCEPPWSDKELEHKLDGAESNAEAKGYKLEERRTLSCETDFELPDSFDERENEGESAAADQTSPFQVIELVDDDDQANKDPGAFPTELLDVPGLINQVVEYSLSTAIYQVPELSFAGALALMSTITGRRVQDWRETRTNLYVLALAASGSGKEHPRKINKRILHGAGMKEYLGPEAFASAQGFLAHVAKSPVGEPIRLFQIDEFGELLATMKDERNTHLYAIAKNMMHMYSASDSTWQPPAKVDTDGHYEIDQPHAVIFGTTVPESFYGNLSTKSLMNGFAARMTVIEPQNSYPDASGNGWSDPPESVLRGVRYWGGFRGSDGNLDTQNPQPMVVPYTDSAMARITTWANGIRKRHPYEDCKVAAIWGRAAQQAAKLALINVCSRWTGQMEQAIVDDDAIEWGIDVSSYLTRRLIWAADVHVTEGLIGEIQNKVLKFLGDPKRQGTAGWVRKNSLTRALQRVSANLRKDAIGTLIEAGRIEQDIVKTGKRAAEVYRLTK